MATTFNKEKFNELVSHNRLSKWPAKRQENKIKNSWSKNSFTIALNILTILEEKEWSKARLAQELEVSSAYVTKVVKGKVNFTLESIAKLEDALGQQLLDISLIDREREKHNYDQMIKWFEDSISIRITKSIKKYEIRTTPIRFYETTTRLVHRKEFNTIAMANANLRPTG